MKKVLITLTLLLLAQAAYAATYYTAIQNPGCSNTGPGSLSQPFCSIQAGVNKMAPGDTLLVRQGTYREEVSLSGLTGGTEASPYVIKNYPGETPVLEGWTTKAAGEWQRCDQVECGDLLNINGLGIDNPNLSQVYKTTIASYGEGFFLFEDGQYYDIARWPEQPDPFFIRWSQYQEIEDTPEGTTNYIQEDEFSQIMLDAGITPVNNFWNGAEFTIVLLNKNSNASDREIASFDKATNRITFDTPLDYEVTYSGTRPDHYSIYNHPFLLDKPGEYYVASNGTGYNLYIIPRDAANLGELKLPSLYSGMILSGQTDHITIEGFEMRGYSGASWSGGVTSRSNSNQHYVTVKNNYFHHMTADSVVLFYGGNNNKTEGNRFEYIKKGSAIRYSSSGYATVKNNTIENVSTSTFIRFQGVDRGVIFGTVASGGGDNHAQGISLYIDSSNILVMNNNMKNMAAAVTFNTGENFSLIGNVFDSSSRNCVAYWAGTYSGCSLFNNTILSRSTDSGKALAASYFVAPGKVKNNIVDGYLASHTNAPTHEYNLYTERAFDQTSNYGWVDGTGEIFAENQHENVFFDYIGENLKLKEGSQAIDTGNSITEDLPSFLDSTFFAEYKALVSYDIEGNPRGVGQGWDIGAYEFQTGQQQECTGSDTSCGIWPNCANCNSQDGCVGENYRDYSCLGTTCTYTETPNDARCMTGPEPMDYLARWAFDDSLADSKASDEKGNYDAACSGTSCPTFLETGGHDGLGAYSFDGENDYLTANSINLGNTSAGTYTFWLYNGGNSDAGIIGANSLNPLAHFTGQNTRVIVNSPGAWPYEILMTSQSLPPQGQWTFYAIAYDSTGGTLYENGNPVGSDNDVSGKAYAETGTLYIGNDRGTIARSFIGRLDDIRIYGRKLSQEEVQAIFQATGEECIDLPALLDYISQWKAGNLNMVNLMGYISQWKSGEGC